MGKFAKRMLSLLLSASIIFTPALSVSAVDGQEGTSQTAQTESAGEEPGAAGQNGEGQAQAAQPMTREEERQAGYAMPIDTNSLTGWPQGPSVYGSAAIVMDMNSGAVPFGKNINEKRYPASITKLLTALVALENSELTDQVEITQDSISCLSSGDSHIGMTPGEILSMEDALYALLLASANEVAHAIAETVGEKLGGGYDTFIQKMNERSQELGCTGSHWTNANGLHDDDHYTTAHDMALIASAVYQNEEFRTITQTLNYTIPPTNLVNESRAFQQKHKMLWPGNKNYYKYATGGKTGYTDNARTTLVTMADNGDLQLAAVVLYDFGADAYVDTAAMFDYVFDNFSKVRLSDQEKPEGVRSFADADAYVLLPAGVDFQDLDQDVTVQDEGSGQGLVTYSYEGQTVGSAEAVLDEDHGAGEDSAPGSQSGDDGQAGTAFTVENVVTAAGAAVLILLFLVLLIVILIKIRQARRRRTRRGAKKRGKRGRRSGRRHRRR